MSESVPSGESSSDPVFDARAGSMQTHAVNGAIATGLSQVFKLPFQVASILVLPRILDPLDYGIYAMVDPLLSIGLLTLDFGIRQTLIQSPTLQRAQASTMFWLMAGAGLALACVFFAISPLIGQFYHEPRAAALAAVSSLFLVNSGLTNIPAALMNRQMKFGWLAIIDAVSIAAGLMAGVVAAKAGMHYWALAIDYGATCAVTLVGVWIGVGWLPGRKLDFTGVGAKYAFGLRLMLTDAATIISRRVDGVLLGRYAGPIQTGLYDRGNKLALIPMDRISLLLERLVLPIMSRIADDGERYRRAYLRMIRQLMLLLVPGTVMVGVTAPVLIPFLLSAKWTEAAPIFAWLALAALHQPVSQTMNFLFISQGRSRAYLVWGVFSAVTTVLAFVIGVRWGAVGVAAVFAISDLTVRLPFLWWCVTLKGPIKQIDLYATAAPFAAAAAVSALALYALQALPFPNAFTQIAASGLVAYAVSIGVLSLFKSGRMTLADTVTLAKSESRRFMLRRKAA